MKENVWVDYEKYNNIVNEILIKEIGHCRPYTQEVILRKPYAMLQSVILLDILNELKEIKEKIQNNEKNVVAQKKEVKTTPKKAE